jgi:type 1 fimbria pilin
MLVCATFAVLTASAAIHAADTTQLEVKGTVRPAPCDLSLTANGEVDFGRIANSRLSDDKPMTIGIKTVQYAINCPTGATRIAIKFVDNRKSSVTAGLAGLATNNHQADGNAFGLGKYNGKNIGVYFLSATNATTGRFVGGDGRVQNGTMYHTGSSNGGKTWQTADSSSRIDLFNDTTNGNHGPSLAGSLPWRFTV